MLGTQRGWAMGVMDRVSKRAARPERPDGIVFHATVHEDRGYHPLMHFGTLRAALERISTRQRDGVRLHVVRLDMGNPVEVPDGDAILHHSPSSHARRLERKGILTQAQADAVARASILSGEAGGALADALAASGHDGLRYRNRFEDAGSTSWCILRADQVSPVMPPVDLALGEVMDLLEGDLDEADLLGRWSAPAGPSP
jgi:hypothetical protein